MEPFLSENFLLDTPTAQRLYHEHAKLQPIIDYHCHIDPREIWEDRRFDNITELWLGGDHYKWRLMRSNGVEERYITGDADPREKFQKFAETLPRAIGNPMYHWCHLELKNYFGYTGVLDGGTAEEVWQLCGEQLRGDPEKSARGFIRSSRVAMIGTTDDPCSDLAWHEKLAADESFPVLVCPSFRPDPALSIHKPGFPAYAERLEETEGWQTALLLHCAREYRRHGWVMQLHFSCVRNPNTRMLAALGPDTGFDCMAVTDSCAAAYRLMNTLDREDNLPRTILYSLNPADNAWLDTLLGAFQSAEVPGKLQHGAAWWFNDHRAGMTEHLTSLANLSLLGNFVGMLTDSRSLLSYARHEYFRRVLCALLGRWAEEGSCPADLGLLGGLAEDVSYRNAKRYFRL